MNDMPDSTPPDLDTDPLAQALRQHWQAGGEPDDAGFSLRVMAVLPARVSPSQRRLARSSEFQQLALDVIIREQYPELRDRLVAETDKRLVQYHGA